MPFLFPPECILILDKLSGLIYRHWEQTDFVLVKYAAKSKLLLVLSLWFAFQQTQNSRKSNANAKKGRENLKNVFKNHIFKFVWNHLFLHFKKRFYCSHKLETSQKLNSSRREIDSAKKSNKNRATTFFWFCWFGWFGSKWDEIKSYKKIKNLYYRRPTETNWSSGQL